LIINNPKGYHLDRICLKVKPLESHKGLPLPGYESEGSSGMDIRACVEGPVSINPGKIKLIPTGLNISIPPDTRYRFGPEAV
jgi:dUTP pyrophosphatase